MTTWKRPKDPFADMTDEEVDVYVDDLFARARRHPTVTISMRVPKDLLTRVKQAADEADVPYQTFIKTLLEATVSRIESRVRPSRHSTKKRREPVPKERVRLYSPAQPTTNLSADRGRPFTASHFSHERPGTRGVTVTATSVAQTASTASGRLAISSLNPSCSLIDGDLECILGAIQRSLGQPLWLLVQSETDPRGVLDESIYDFFARNRTQLRADGPAAVLIDTPGGSEIAAFKLARLLSRECGMWTALVARRAKSAGTLLALGADRLVMGRSAELGPLDPQLFDSEEREYRSALQYLSDCHAAVKNCASVLPTLERAPRPWVRVAQRAEALAVVEEVREQAIRLLLTRHSRPDAEAIAERLVFSFSNHDFPIHSTDANSIGLVTEVVSTELANLFDALATNLGVLTLVGRLQARTQVAGVC